MNPQANTWNRFMESSFVTFSILKHPPGKTFCYGSSGQRNRCHDGQCGGCQADQCQYQITESLSLQGV